MGKLDPVKAQMMKRAEFALRQIGNDLHGKAADLAPKEEGTLEGAGTVTIDRTPNSISLTVSFNTPYAAAQHEGVDFEHPLKGQAKYLEQPFKQMLPRYEAALQKAMGL